MNKNTLLKILNPILLISLVIQAATGITIAFFKPTKMIMEIHEHNGIVFVALVITHLTLNWGWIKASFLSKKT